MQINLHAIGKNAFSVNIHELPGNVPVMRITVGQAEVDIFLHDEHCEKALADIDTAIRAFMQSREEWHCEECKKFGENIVSNQ